MALLAIHKLKNIIKLIPLHWATSRARSTFPSLLLPIQLPPSLLPFFLFPQLSNQGMRISSTSVRLLRLSLLTLHLTIQFPSYFGLTPATV